MAWSVGTIRWGEFSLLSIGWEHVFWAEGAEFVALGLSDGGTVVTWPDEIGTSDITNGNAAQRPTYVASDPTFGQPAVRFDGSDDNLFVSGGDWPDISQPYEIVMVMRFRSRSADFLYSSSPGTTGADARDTAGSQYLFAAGASLSGGTTDTTQHLLRAVHDGASSSFNVDEVSTMSGNAGTFAMQGLTMARSSSGIGPAAIDVPFFGVVAGTLTTQERADIHAYCQAHYGTA